MAPNHSLDKTDSFIRGISLLAAHGNSDLLHRSTHLNRFEQSPNSRHQIWEGSHCLPHVCTKMMSGRFGGYPFKQNHVCARKNDITFRVVSLWGHIPSLAYLSPLGKVARTVDGLNVNYYPPLGQTKGVRPLSLPPLMDRRSAQNAGFRLLVSIHFKYIKNWIVQMFHLWLFRVHLRSLKQPIPWPS